MSTPGRETVVAEPGWLWPTLAVVLPAVGATAGWLLARGGDWWQQRDLPLPGPLRLLVDAPEPWLTIGALTLGAVAGLVLLVAWRHDSPVVTLTPDRIRYVRAGVDQDVDRRTVAAAFVESGHLVILDRAGAELLHAPCDLSADRLAAAFADHGIRWHPDGDPYRAAYRRWVPGMPELGGAADALFTARGKALERHDADDSEQLRIELGHLGIVVDDRDGRQHWRLPQGKP